MNDFFISYSSFDRAWAEWIAWQLEEAGFQAILDCWDFQPGSNFVLAINRASQKANKTLAVLSPHYLTALYTQSEWAAAFTRDPPGQGHALLPVKVQPCDVQGLLRSLVVLDLTGLDEGAARGTLLRGIADLRMKPAQKPRYPVPSTAAPDFPGEVLSKRNGPRFDNDEVRKLSDELALAYQAKEEILVAGTSVASIQQDILDLRRRIREGGQLRAGDFLHDGRYRLIEPLGKGGFATVWKAVDRRTTDLVAVKILHVDLAQDRSRCERFFRGARKMAEAHHQGIVRVIEQEIDDGGYKAFVMEYIEGGDFYHAVRSQQLSMRDRIRILVEVGAVLQFAHENGIVHRDVKPANILLTRDLRPKLTDFDLVRASDTTGGTRTGMLGTFLYTAPESMERAKEAGKPADVYSLGMTFLFALSDGDLGSEALRSPERMIQALPIPRDAKKALTQAVAWAPEDRTPSAAALCASLKRHLETFAGLEMDEGPASSLDPEQAGSTPNQGEILFSFETFVTGESNSMAYSAAMAVAQKPFISYNPLLIHGQHGLGKTHLLRAVAHELSRSHANLRVYHLTAEQFVNDLIDSIRNDKMPAFRERYRSVDVLIMDDVHFIANKERTQEEFLHTINALLAKSAQIVLASTFAPRAIPMLEEHVRARLELGLVVGLQVPSVETKMQIARLKSMNEGIILPESISELIAVRCFSTSELEGAVKRIAASISLSGKTISSELVAEVLAEVAPGSRRIDPSEIIKTVARHFELKVMEIKSKSNVKAIAFPRQVAMYLCKRMTVLSYPEIGRLFNDKHHSTVMYAVKRIEDMRKADIELDKLIRGIEQQIGWR